MPRPPPRRDPLIAASRHSATAFVSEMVVQGVIEPNDHESISVAIRIAAELERVQILMRAQRRRFTRSR